MLAAAQRKHLALVGASAAMQCTMQCKFELYITACGWKWNNTLPD